VNAKKWKTCSDPGPMLDFLRGAAGERKLRLFAVACLRSILPAGAPFHSALDAAEEVAGGKPSRQVRKSFDEWGAIAMEAGDPLGWAMHFALDDAASIVHLDREFTDWICGLREGVSESAERKRFADHLRCIFGNPFRPVSVEAAWLTPAVRSLARRMDQARDFSQMPALADALEESGCANSDVLDHCRSRTPHVRGCWVVDLLLGME